MLSEVLLSAKSATKQAIKMAAPSYQDPVRDQPKYPMYPPAGGPEIAPDQTPQQGPFFVSSRVAPTAAQIGPFPTQMECPFCKQDIYTDTDGHAGLLSWLLGIGLCMLGCNLGCCLIPCFVKVSW